MKFVLPHLQLASMQILRIQLRFNALAPLPSYKYVQHKSTLFPSTTINFSPYIYSIFHFKFWFIIYDYLLFKNRKGWSKHNSTLHAVGVTQYLVVNQHSPGCFKPLPGKLRKLSLAFNLILNKPELLKVKNVPSIQNWKF